MKLNFRPFDLAIHTQATAKTRSRYNDNQIIDIDIEDEHIHARVKGSAHYIVEIFFNQERVLNASCTCPYDYGDYCKHIVHVMIHADLIWTNRPKTREEFEHPQQPLLFPEETTLPEYFQKKEGWYTLIGKHVLKLPEKELNSISYIPKELNNWSNRPQLVEATFGINKFDAVFRQNTSSPVQHIQIQQEDNNLKLRCDCTNLSPKICRHLYYTIQQIQHNKPLQLSFDKAERHQVLKKQAAENGWTGITNLDDFYDITLSYDRIYIKPRIKVLAYTESKKRELKKQLLSPVQLPDSTEQLKKEILVVRESAYGDYLFCHLVTAPLTKSGDIKSPIEELKTSNRIRSAKSNTEILFYIALEAINNYGGNNDYYRDVIKNPLNLECYIFKENTGNDKITPNKITPLKLNSFAPQVGIIVKETGDFYNMSCFVQLESTKIPSSNIRLFGPALIHAKSLYCFNNESEINVLTFFNQNQHEVFLPKAQFESFKEEFLDQLENTISVQYSFIKPAPKSYVKENRLDVVSRQYIYLSELGDFVLITPALSYGDIEVPVLSRKTLYSGNPDGSMYEVQRDQAKEQQFIHAIQTQHPTFEGIPQSGFYYLHKKEFLQDGWFIDAFEAWRAEGFTILGFNKLKNNRYNEHKIKVKTSVQSGIDWFDIHADVSFGNQEVSLKQIQKSIANKTRYVELNDGTQGILPQAWIEKFADYFRAGELKDNSIRTHKSNFQLIDDLFENEVLSQEAQLKVHQYVEKLHSFHSISSVKVPKKLKAVLRDYQKEGLNWLNFLDEFGFGGCLADDMGLGKTVQVIAYFLSQHEKGNKQPNLVILPTSLLFNWQRELDKFAPHLKYHVQYGNNRKAEKLNINDYSIILTTYGTLLADIELLKKLSFNIIVLDESQAIKNPDSKRYKAVRLLNGRQRLVLTGTPIENNTFDLYAQLSFAMPGLLGSAKHFAMDYSTPIDKFQDDKRAKELQRKINPFVLRRTKKQVATELPEKTEMVIYCEMGTEQKRVYENYKIEFQKYLAGLPEDELLSSSIHILQGMTKLRQICNSPALLSDEEFYGDQSAKLEELLSQISSLKDNHKILVFSQFVGMLDLVKQKLDEEQIGYAYLTGQTKNREQQVEQFQEDENTRVFLISLKAGGTGLNLTEAEYVFLIDPWWNPAVENQAIDRAYRIGQKNKVIAVRLITPNSIEEKIMELQQRKQQLADDLVHADNNMLKQLSKDDLIRLLG